MLAGCLPGIIAAFHLPAWFNRQMRACKKKGLLQRTKQEGNDRNYYEDYHQDFRYFHRKAGDPFCTNYVEDQCENKEYYREPD